MAKLELKYIVGVMIIISSQGYIRSIVNIVRLDNTNLIITILLRKIKVLGRKKCIYIYIYMNHELASVFVKFFFKETLLSNMSG